MQHKTAAELIAFETEVKTLWESGDLPFLLHMCGGNEEDLIRIFSEVNEGDYVLSTHRSHYHYLLAGGRPVDLLDQIKRGNSMFIFDRKLNFLTSSIVAGTPAIAAGIALALKRHQSRKRVWCFVGDGAEDHGHFYEAVRFVDGHGLPCTFVIEDNDRSVDTPKRMRHGSNRMIWPYGCVRRYTYKPTYPHAGSGCKFKIEFKTPAVVRA
jgi:pyruvate dehydrogenase E1 component alpha subunit